MVPAKGKLYLIPSPLGDIAPLEVLPLSVKKAVEEIQYFVVEHEKSARKFIKSLASRKSQAELQIRQINKYTDPAEIPEMIQPCLQGQDVGIISDAGCPGIADPGAQVVTEAHRNDITVVPLVGPSSVILAMMASGLNGQNFAFNGYLPIDKRERRSAMKKLERLSGETGQAQVFIETPYRNNQLLESILATVQDDTRVCVACDITLPDELIKTLPACIWRKKKVDLNKRPTIFIIQKA